MANSSSNGAAEVYRQGSASVQKVAGQNFLQEEVCPQAGDAILDLGCGTGELSAYLAELVGPEGKVVGVDPDKERILLAQQTHGEIRNLLFVEGSASNFPGMSSQSYDIIFSNHVIHWIPDKQEVFRNMFKSLKRGGKIAIQYIEHFAPSLFRAYKELNPENAEHIAEMYQFEDRAKIESYCSLAGFHILKSYHAEVKPVVFQSIKGLLIWLCTTSHGVFDPKLVTEERLQRYYPYSSRDGKPPFDFQAGLTERSCICRLVAVKQAGEEQ